VTKRKKKLPVLQKRVDRVCGGCNACCSVLAIQELKKPAGQDCTHLDRSKPEHHCTVYETRPRDCSDYTCAWVREPGFGGDEHRPDKIGVLFTPRDNKWEVEPFAGPFTLIAHETRPGAFAEEAATKFMEYIGGHFIIFAFWGPKLDKCRTVGPAHKIKKIFEWCHEHHYSKITGILKGSLPDVKRSLFG